MQQGQLYLLQNDTPQIQRISQMFIQQLQQGKSSQQKIQFEKQKHVLSQKHIDERKCLYKSKIQQKRKLSTQTSKIPISYQSILQQIDNFKINLQTNKISQIQSQNSIFENEHNKQNQFEYRKYSIPESRKIILNEQSIVGSQEDTNILSNNISNNMFKHDHIVLKSNSIRQISAASPQVFSNNCNYNSCQQSKDNIKFTQKQNLKQKNFTSIKNSLASQFQDRIDFEIEEKFSNYTKFNTLQNYHLQQNMAKKQILKKYTKK